MTAIEFAAPADGFVAAFIKSGPRPALEISTVSMGLSGVLANDVFSNVRVAIGAVAPTPLRARQTEAVLEGRLLDENSIERVVKTAADEVSPIDDVRASAWYRKHLTGVYIRRLLSHVTGN
jgi:CO/xanthine dehydrogenase FAD-binding subunit